MALDATTYLGRSEHRTSGATRAPRFLEDAAEWVDKVYMIERSDDTYTADQVLGGRNGVSNLPHQALANRTAFLYERQNQIIEFMNQLAEYVAPLVGGSKKLVFGTTNPNDSNTVFVQLPSAPSGGTDTTIVLSNGSTLKNPALTLTLDNGGELILNTDGTSGASVSSISTSTSHGQAATDSSQESLTPDTIAPDAPIIIKPPGFDDYDADTDADTDDESNNIDDADFKASIDALINGLEGETSGDFAIDDAFKAAVDSMIGGLG